MKRHYVVRLSNGYYEAKNKKDAFEELKNNDLADDVVYTTCVDGNYYHNRINVIASK
ncbi:MAG: hypothetical protein ACFFDN_50075 [Candidatus Hodarchaeota archaeon]